MRKYRYPLKSLFKRTFKENSLLLSLVACKPCKSITIIAAYTLYVAKTQFCGTNVLKFPCAIGDFKTFCFYEIALQNNI